MPLEKECKGFAGTTLYPKNGRKAIDHCPPCTLEELQRPSINRHQSSCSSADTLARLPLLTGLPIVPSLKSRTVVLDTKTFIYLMDMGSLEIPRSASRSSNFPTSPAGELLSKTYCPTMIDLREVTKIYVLPRTLGEYAAVKDIPFDRPVIDNLPLGVTIAKTDEGTDQIEKFMHSAVLQAMCGTTKNGTQVKKSNKLASLYGMKLQMISWAFRNKAVILAWEPLLDSTLKIALEAAGFGSLEYVSILVPPECSHWLHESPKLVGVSLNDHGRRAFEPLHKLSHMKNALQKSLVLTTKPPAWSVASKYSTMSKDRGFSASTSITPLKRIHDPSTRLRPATLSTPHNGPMVPSVSVVISANATKIVQKASKVQIKWFRKRREPLLVYASHRSDTPTTGLESCFESDDTDTSSIYSPIRSFELPFTSGDKIGRSSTSEQRGDKDNKFQVTPRRNSDSSVSAALSALEFGQRVPLPASPVPTTTIKYGSVTSSKPHLIGSSRTRRMMQGSAASPHLEL